MRDVTTESAVSFVKLMFASAMAMLAVSLQMVPELVDIRGHAGDDCIGDEKPRNVCGIR